MNCRDKPVAKWREDAFTVLTVLTLRQSVPPLGEEELARRWVQAQAASSFESLQAALRIQAAERERIEAIYERWCSGKRPYKLAGHLRAAYIS